MTVTLGNWIDQQMTARHVRSLQVFARMIGVNALDLAAWTMGERTPADADYALLATACGEDKETVSHFPLRALNPDLDRSPRGARATLRVSYWRPGYQPE